MAVKATILKGRSSALFLCTFSGAQHELKALEHFR